MMLCAETTAARTTVSNADECMVKCVLECEVGRFSVTREVLDEQTELREFVCFGW